MTSQVMQAYSGCAAGGDPGDGAVCVLDADPLRVCAQCRGRGRRPCGCCDAVRPPAAVERARARACAGAVPVADESRGRRRRGGSGSRGDAECSVSARRSASGSATHRHCARVLFPDPDACTPGAEPLSELDPACDRGRSLRSLCHRRWRRRLARRRRPDARAGGDVRSTDSGLLPSRSPGSAVCRALQEAERRYAASSPIAGGRPLPEVRALAFEGVSYAYRPGRPVLSDISFEVVGGEAIGVVGPSGAGKSTLVQILLRLRDADHGDYLVNGTACGRVCVRGLARAGRVCASGTSLDPCLRGRQHTVLPRYRGRRG